MRLNKYLLIAAMGLGLFACTDDLENNGGQNGNKGDGQLADVSIKLDFNGSQTRAEVELPDNNYDQAGSQEESKVNTLRVIVTDDKGIVEYNQLYQGTTGDNKLPDGINGNSKDNYEGTGTIKTFQIPTGPKTFYVYVNEEVVTPPETTRATTDNAADLKIAVGSKFIVPTAKQEAAAYFADETNGFHMSGLVKQEITTMAAGSVNEVTVNVDRVVAKVQLRLAATYPDTDTEKKVTLKSLTAGIGNADLEFTPEADGETDNTLWGTYRFAYDDNNVRKTPYYDEVPEDDNYENVLMRYANEEEGEEDDLLTKQSDAYPTYTYYCLENTHQTYKKGNTTFVKITAQMIPTATVKFEYTAASGAGDTGTPESIKIVQGAEIPDGTEAATFHVITKVAKPAPEDEGTHLNSYIWESDLLDLYSITGFIANEDKNNIADFDGTNPEHQIQAVRNALSRRHYEVTDAYEGGYGYFYKAVNDIKEGDKYIKKAPVFRNHWYDLTINSIKLPGNPNSKFDGGEDLHPDTDVDMTVSIRKWHKVDHTVDLE